MSGKEKTFVAVAALMILGAWNLRETLAQLRSIPAPPMRTIVDIRTVEGGFRFTATVADLMTGKVHAAPSFVVAAGEQGTANSEGGEVEVQFEGRVEGQSASYKVRIADVDSGVGIVSEHSASATVPGPVQAGR